jgi:hypothetical protein
VAEVIADSGTLCSEAYALETEILPSDRDPERVAKQRP